MKVLHVIDSGGLYGAEIMLLNLAAEQIRLGLEPVIASIGEPGEGEKPLEKEARKQGINIQPFRMAPGPNIAGALRILRFARKFDVDLLHSHGYKGNILLGAMPRRIRRKPLISTLHGWTGTGGFNKMSVYQALDWLSLHFVDAVVCVNKAMLEKSELKRSRFRRIHVVDNGLPDVDIPIYSNRSEAKRLFPTEDAALFDTKFNIGTIGRLSEEKGYQYLITALRLVLDSGVDARLFIIGEGKQRRMLSVMAQKCGLQERVHLIGYRPNASRFMPLFDVYVISSLTEGLPITLLEAMQSRTPVVATHVGGIPIVLENGRSGVLVNPADPRSLANGITKIAKEQDIRKTLAQNAYDRFISTYSSRKMAEGYLNLYLQINE